MTLPKICFILALFIFTNSQVFSQVFEPKKDLLTEKKNYRKWELHSGLLYGINYFTFNGIAKYMDQDIRFNQLRSNVYGIYNELKLNQDHSVLLRLSYNQKNVHIIPLSNNFGPTDIFLNYLQANLNYNYYLWESDLSVFGGLSFGALLDAESATFDNFQDRTIRINQTEQFENFIYALDLGAKYKFNLFGLDLGIMFGYELPLSGNISLDSDWKYSGLYTQLQLSYKILEF